MNTIFIFKKIQLLNNNSHCIVFIIVFLCINYMIFINKAKKNLKYKIKLKKRKNKKFIFFHININFFSFLKVYMKKKVKKK